MYFSIVCIFIIQVNLSSRKEDSIDNILEAINIMSNRISTIT